MDTSGFSQVGKYGTISLMKRQDPNVAVTAFGIDSEEVTFGRDPNCSVRLYYPDVSLIHCKVLFEERKAFLVVLGAGGLIVDGCQVYPSSSPNEAASPVTIPLSNNSEFEIKGKKFRFAYPPKELRAALLATPSRPDRRAPRLSMIQSAQVFSPKPSNDPRENLRILKSPLKNTFKSPVKREFSTPSRTRIFAPPSSPLKALAQVQEAEDEEDEEDDDIVLVEGNHPRVVEEEADLIILEDVVPQAPISRGRSQTPVAAPQPVQAPPPQEQQQQVPQTPRRRKASLHRAVLIRSAQRAVYRAETEERERQEEEEEMEVLESVASPVVGDSDEEPEAENPVPEPETEPSTPTSDSDHDTDSDEDEDEEERATPIQKLNWRKSLENLSEKLWPFRSSSPGKEDDPNAQKSDSESDSEDEDELHEQDEEQHEEEEDEIVEEPAPLPHIPPAQTPARRPLGSFMTPQVKPRTAVSTGSSNPFSRLGIDDGQSRRSVEPQRFTPRRPDAGIIPKTEQLWRVRDLLHAPESALPQRTPFARPTEQQQLPRQEGIASPSRSTRRVVDEAERQAIRERRRSALRELDSPFGGAVPGLGHTIRSPMKIAAPSTATSSSSSSSTSATSASPMKSPSKLFRLADLSVQKEEPAAEQEQDENEDTRSLLDKMMETVEGMKRRRSMAGTTPARPPSQGLLPRMSLGFDRRPLSPSKVSGPTASLHEDDEDEDDKENQATPMGVDENMPESPMISQLVAERNAPRFSLLRSSVLADIRPQDDDDEDAMDIDEPEPVHEQLAEQNHHSEESDTEMPPASTSFDQLSEPEREAEREAEIAKEQEIHEAPPAKAASRRGARKQPQPEESADEAEPLPAPTRRARRTPTVEPEDHPAPVAPRRGRSRSATVEPEEPAAAIVTKAKEPAKRGRKPTVDRIEEAEPEAEAEEAAAPVPVKAGGRKKAPAPAAIDDEEETAPSPAPVPKKGRVARPTSKIATSAATRRAEKAKASEPEEDGDDELDMIDEAVVEAKPTRGRKKVVKEDVAEPKPTTNPPPTRIARVKSTTSLKPPAATTTRTARPAATTAKSATTAIKTPAVRARTTRKTPATAPAAVLQSGDKENTPDPDASSGAVTEEPVKVRVSKTTKKAASGTSIPTRRAVKKEVEVEPAAAKGKVMRATRARTKA